MIAQAREKFGLDASPFDKLLDLREGKIKPRELDPGPLFPDYMKQIQAVIDIVDGLEG